MIKRLQRKFIFINMASVCLILLGTLLFSLFSYHERLARDSRRFMDFELSHSLGETEDRQITLGREPDKGGAAGRQPEAPENGLLEQLMAVTRKEYRNDGSPGNFLPFVVYQVDAEGDILMTVSRSLTVDEDTAAVLVDRALTQADRNGNGVIRDYSLRYLVRPVKGGTAIIFSDMSFEKDSFYGMLTTHALIFAACFVLFFLFSLVLSRWALAPAERAWKQQNRFVADASHELKTPITVILANLNILSQHADDTIREQSRWVTNTREEAERMRQLVEDLLFLAKSDANTLPALKTEIDLSNLAEDRALNFEAVAFEKHVTLDEDIVPDIRLSGNEGQLRQLITILLDNAVKYAGVSGSVRLSLAMRNEKAVLSVTNTGEPIDEEDLPHIFERFYRADKSRARTEGGYGLGLAIAENIVRAHGGDIRCTSSREDGTVFTVTLPLAAKQARSQ